MEYITIVYAESHLRIRKEQNYISRQKRLSSTIKNTETSESYEAFKMFDADGDGKVTLSDLQHILAKLSYGGQTTDTKIKEILKRKDKDHSKAITFDKFTILWNNLSNGENDMRKAFNKLDLNNDGYITKDELAQYLNGSGLSKREKEANVHKSFTFLDLNGDGKISYPEFFMAWKFLC